MAAAQTGTGKTAGFTLPLLQLLRPGKSAASNRCRALVLTPTRELAAQVGESVATYGQHMTMRSAVVYGGVKINPQMMALRKGADVLIATPGRLMDLYQQNAISFSDVEFLVLDEADRMLDMGFIHDIKKILALCPPNAKTCSSPPPSPMTSASWPWAFCITRWRSTSARKTLLQRRSINGSTRWTKPARPSCSAT